MLREAVPVWGVKPTLEADVVSGRVALVLGEGSPGVGHGPVAARAVRHGDELTRAGSPRDRPLRAVWWWQREQALASRSSTAATTLRAGLRGCCLRNVDPANSDEIFQAGWLPLSESVV